jgi:hypothetical protein
MAGQTVGALTAKVCCLSLVCMLHRCTWWPGDTSLSQATFLTPGALVGVPRVLLLAYADVTSGRRPVEVAVPVVCA